MADLDKLLQALKVKNTGKSRYLVNCPAHKDTNPSMLVKVQDTGKITVNCYTGCTAKAILTALRLDFTVLYLNDKPFVKVNPNKYLDEIIVKIFAFDLKNKHKSHPSDRQTYFDAKKRIAFYAQRH